MLSKIFFRVFNLIKKTANALENSTWPMAYVCLTFFFAISIRNFIESYSDNGRIAFEPYFHFYVAYLALALSFVLLFYFATKIAVPKLIRLIFPCFIILPSAPLLDLLLSYGKGFDMNYMMPGLHDDLLRRFFTFFGPLQPMAVTPCIRIEIALILLVSFFYFFTKSGHFLKSFLWTIIMYALFFLYGAFPFLFKILNAVTGISFWANEITLIYSFLTISLFLGVLLTYLANPDVFKSLMDDVCWYRVAHYELMIVLGIIVAHSYVPLPITPRFIFWCIFAPASLFFAGMVSLISNNLADVDIDRISNKNRVLPAAKVKLEFYRGLQMPFAVLAVFFAAIISFQVLFLIILFMAGYFLYSMPPLRLKRIPFFSKICISLNSLLMVMLGFVLLKGTLHDFPISITAYFLIVFTAPINFIDLKDYEGDKHAGILTLPVLWGIKCAKVFIGLSFIAAYVCVLFVLKNIYLLLPLLVLGGIQYYLINKPKYNEKQVFQVYLFGIVVFMLYTLFFNIHF